ncbi:Hypothetical protein D9617_3g019760 [Elsinoe fawcettii]|nr:Hypothetical protein D9617_3g019760 [Elsinoe fawcettii]
MASDPDGDQMKTNNLILPNIANVSRSMWPVITVGRGNINGERPTCAACQDRELECHYEADPDTTRAGTLKRSYAALEEETQSLRRLVDLLRNRPRAQIESVVRHLRGGEDIQSIVHTVETARQNPRSHLSDAQWTTFASGRDTLRDWVRSNFVTLYPVISPSDVPSSPALSSSSARDGRMRIDNLLSTPDSTVMLEQKSSRIATVSTGAPLSSMSESRPLADDRLALVQPSMWTSVQISRIEMANLLSAYLSWHHTEFRFFDEEAFIQDLISGEKQYCSRLLVSSILSFVVIKLGGHDRVRLKALRLRFIEEANRLWSESLQDISVTTVSAACVLSMSNYLHSNEGLSMDILQHGYHVAGRLGIFVSTPAPIPEDPTALKAYKAIAIAGWGYYSICTISALHVPEGPTCPRQPSMPTFEEDISDIDKWQPWPRILSSTASVPVAGSRYGAFCSLAKLIADYTLLRQHLINSRITNRDKNDLVSLQMATILLHNLTDWSNKLPQQLRCHPMARPHVLAMHITVHTVIMECFRPFLGRDQTSTQVYTSSLKQVTELIRQSRNSWGDLPNLTTSVGMLHIVAFSLIPFLGKDKDAGDSFLLILEILHHQSKTNPVVVDLLKYVLSSAVERGSQLPQEAKDILQELQTWEEELEAEDRVDTSTFSFIIDLEMLHSDMEAASLRSSLKKKRRELKHISDGFTAHI